MAAKALPKWKARQIFAELCRQGFTATEDRDGSWKYRRGAGDVWSPPYATWHEAAIAALNDTGR